MPSDEKKDEGNELEALDAIEKEASEFKKVRLHSTPVAYAAFSSDRSG